MRTSALQHDLALSLQSQFFCYDLFKKLISLDILSVMCYIYSKLVEIEISMSFLLQLIGLRTAS